MLAALLAGGHAAVFQAHAAGVSERLLELFADAGLTPTDAARASHLLFGYVFSSVALDIADLNQPGSPSTAERIAARHQALAGAPTGQFPRVVAAAAAMASNISTEQFLWGLHRILDGITTSQGIDPESTTARCNAASNGPDVH
jgi:TetR/AcrR family transcriptional regulator, tetracycline repressor protein